MGAHHLVTCVTGAIISWSCSVCTFAFSLFLQVNGIDLGVLTQNSTAPSTMDMWKSSPFMVQILPSNMLECSLTRSSGIGLQLTCPIELGSFFCNHALLGYELLDMGSSEAICLSPWLLSMKLMLKMHLDKCAGNHGMSLCQV